MVVGPAALLNQAVIEHPVERAVEMARKEPRATGGLVEGLHQTPAVPFAAGQGNENPKDEVLQRDEVPRCELHSRQ